MNTFLSKLPSFYDEPVVYTSAVASLIGLATAFGVPIDPEQKAALLVVLGVIATFFARQQVYPASHVALSTSDVLEAHNLGATDVPVISSPAVAAPTIVEPAPVVEPAAGNETK